MEIYESDKDTVKHDKNAFLKVNAFPESDIVSDLGLGHCTRPKQVTSWCGICLKGGGGRAHALKAAQTQDVATSCDAVQV